MSTNTITVVGNLTADPELRFIGNGNAVVNLSVAATGGFAIPNPTSGRTSLTAISMSRSGVTMPKTSLNR